jgi:hypothetical protein
MTSIKIGREEYEIKKGDYILDNGACYQFCAGDRRTLKMQGWHSYSSLRVSKTAIKHLKLETLEKKENTSLGFTCIYYYL